MIRQNQKYLNRVLIFIDAISILVSLILAYNIRFRSGIIDVRDGYLTFKQYVYPMIFIIPLYIFIYSLFDLYTPQRVRKSFDEFISIIKSNAVGLLIFILVLYIFKVVDYSRYLIVIFSILCILLTFIERLTLRIMLKKLRTKGYNQKYILIVGLSEITYELMSKIVSNRHWGYNIIGILDDNVEIGSLMANDNLKGKINNIDLETRKKAVEIAKYFKDTKIIGKIAKLNIFLDEFNIDEVFITLNLEEYNKIGSIINTCENSGIRAQIIPGYYKYIPAKPYLEDMDGLPMINLRYVPLDNLFNNFIKRSFDIVFSIISIILFSPIMLITALIMKASSRGPVIFKQERIGISSRPFTMYKFRSMEIQTIENKNEDKTEGEIKDNQWTVQNDRRITGFGAFIRQTSIDEFPQLFNVLKGDMSLIGPRPERRFYVDKFKEEIPKYMIKHHVRPGMTGWAQVHGWRGDTSINKRIEYDIFYIENWSLTMDIKILGLTVFKGFVNKNAY